MEAPAMKYGAAAIFSAIGVAGSVVSMVRLDPSGWLITMTIASYFCFLVVFFSDRIESFSLRDMAAKLKEIETKAASTEEIAKMSAQLAIETMHAARDSDFYGSSSSSESSSSSWEDVEESADELRQKLNAQQAAPRNGA
jgi:hypothetical protein